MYTFEPSMAVSILESRSFSLSDHLALYDQGTEHDAYIAVM